MASGSHLTLVVTTFDRPEYLRACLASISQQTLGGFRIIVLDNASSADYSGVLDQFRELNVTYVRNETNLGPTGNIAKAMRSYTDTKYLVVFHDDDMMQPQMLEWQYRLLEDDPGLQFVSTELAAFEDGETPIQRRWDDIRPEVEIYGDGAELARSLLGAGGLCFGSTMYRSSVLGEVQVDDSRFGIIWDRPFLLDIACHGRAALIRAPLVSYRHHPGQDTKTGALSANNLIELMKAYRAALPGAWDRADQELFYHHSVNFLIRYGYARLAPAERIGAARFIRRCVRGGVLRLSDVRPGDIADLLRTDGRRLLPAAIDAMRAAKRQVSSRRRAAADSRVPPPVEGGQARRTEE